MFQVPMSQCPECIDIDYASVFGLLGLWLHNNSSHGWKVERNLASGGSGVSWQRRLWCGCGCCMAVVVLVGLAEAAET